MNVKEIQLWLKNNGFDPGKVDGVMGKQTKAAIQKAQQYLSSLNLYNAKVDGEAGNTTQAAMRLFDQGKREFKAHGVKFNIYDSRSVADAFNKLKQQGVTNVKFGDQSVNLNGGNALNQFMEGASNLTSKKSDKSQSDFAAKDNNISEQTEGNAISRWWNNSALGSFINGTKVILNSEATSKPTPNVSSYKEGDLENLLERYAYDVYHDNPIDNEQWGFTYSYKPRRPGINLISGIGGSKAQSIMGNPGLAELNVTDTNKYSQQDAEAIARGAGLKSYIYGGKKYNVNLFNVGKGAKYANEEMFNKVLENAKAGESIEAAQALYNEELARQYNNFGTDYRMLNDKRATQWNNLFGVIGFGYNPESTRATVWGEQARDINGTSQVGGLTTLKPQYVYDPETDQGRLLDTDYDTWYNYAMGFKTFTGHQDPNNNVGMSPIRASAVKFQAGFPLHDPRLRSQVAFLGANADPGDIDASNYYYQTDPNRGTAQMKAHLYDEITKNNFKNVPAAYEYLTYILTSSPGKYRSKSSYNIDMEKADQLARAAGLPLYHRYNSNKNNTSFIENRTIGLSAHDMYDSLKSFYENGFDENGRLKPTFKYGENGYDHHVDSGNYTAFIRNGQFQNALDDWNIDFAGHNFNMSANEGRGIALINRNKNYNGEYLPEYFQSPSMRIGGLLRYITRNK